MAALSPELESHSKFQTLIEDDIDTSKGVRMGKGANMEIIAEMPHIHHIFTMTFDDQILR